MAGARTLSAGKIKFTVCTTKPVNPAKPLLSELTAGIDLSCDILTSDFSWTAADSEKIAEKALCDKNNSNALGAGNFTAGVTLWRKFDVTTGAASPADEPGWTALNVKGTEVWCYARETGKDSTEPWTASDEIYLGGSVLVDSPQRTDGTGFIKRRIPMEPQSMYENITVAAA